jgi:hypothetical protein
MTPNHKLTNVIKGRIVEDLQMNTAEVSMRFSDGSTMLVKGHGIKQSPVKERRAHPHGLRTIGEVHGLMRR